MLTKSRARNIAVFGVPSSVGARNTGQELAPRRLRDAGLLDALAAHSAPVVDLGDVDGGRFSPDRQNPKAQNLGAVVDVLRSMDSMLDEAFTQQQWPLILGGDCSISIAVAAAMRRRFGQSVGVIYLDGDVDFNTPESTHTGILDGMVMAHMVGRGAPELAGYGNLGPLLPEDQVALFGYSVKAGGVDPSELNVLPGTRLLRFPLEIINGDIEASATQALQLLAQRVQHIMLHFDVDVVDYHELPAADVPHSPGLSLQQTAQALRVFLASPLVETMVVTEFNAGRDRDGALARRLVDLIANALANKRPTD